jgi:hypothetical protein
LNTSPRLLLYTTFLLSSLLGCAPSQRFVSEEEEQPVPQKIETPKEKKRPLAEYEATLKPSDFDKEVEIAQPVQEEKKPQVPIAIPKDTLVMKEEVVQGFRIQIFSSSNVDEATLIRNLAIEKFTGDSIYVVFDAPVYKVRIGDFINRYEANQRLPEFVEKGYRDAWIVPDKVIQRKYIRVSMQ